MYKKYLEFNNQSEINNWKTYLSHPQSMTIFFFSVKKMLNTIKIEGTQRLRNYHSVTNFQENSLNYGFSERGKVWMI